MEKMKRSILIRRSKVSILKEAVSTARADAVGIIIETGERQQLLDPVNMACSCSRTKLMERLC